MSQQDVALYLCVHVPMPLLKETVWLLLEAGLLHLFGLACVLCVFSFFKMLPFPYGVRSSPYPI